MAETKNTTQIKVDLYNNPNLSKEIIEAAAKREIDTLNAQEVIQKAIREEKREEDKVEKERKERLDKEARERADKIFKSLTSEPKCCVCSPLGCKKVALVLLVLLDIAAFTCWVHNPTEANFEQLIAPILFVSMVFTLIILLGRSIEHQEKEESKQKAEMEKELFMRRLK